MQKHFFTFRKHTYGQPQIDIEVVVAADICRKEAKRIAEEEIKALQDGHALRVHGDLRRKVAQVEQSIVHLPDYRFIGAN